MRREKEMKEEEKRERRKEENAACNFNVASSISPPLISGGVYIINKKKNAYMLPFLY